ncbi:NADPH:adrenodoxin oxidoreductase, mitochondrial-like protein [Sarcoptes scabiei]|uniref:NADPH:adrenodoxin oxidoreductase, mitochondrial n=1 Tax=Sarcoptes scabiei TaxID=52283 RepID=A0A132ACJ2_SARSC|nr:NADPH:adrenodoxin oxidoreductase, mitochondrial-like protein [Sarcoptes scabiei]
MKWNHLINARNRSILISNSIFQQYFAQNFCTETNRTDYKIAIIGSGPAGFYTSQQLLKYSNLSVDIYEKFPVPFGLVRFGVAPDHQEVKNVINTFTKVATNVRTRFIGNLTIGKDVKLDELRDAYHAVVLCYGSSQDNQLNLENEHRFGNIFSARRFVGWYNGIPQDKDIEISLKVKTAIIVGQGNVALDCARILLSCPKRLKTTDITSHASRELSESLVKKVILIGRRGPFQGAFRIKEFRELTKIDDCQVKFDWPESSRKKLNLDDSIIDSLPRSRKRLAELFKKTIEESKIDRGCSKECHFKFFSSPIELISDGIEPKPMIKRIRFKKNTLNDYFAEDARIIENHQVGEEEDSIEEIDCGLLIKSIGYRAISIDDSIPFDHKKGTILNENGRVTNNPGVYCSGWAAFGATGVIVNTMNNSFEVGKLITEDIESGKLDSDSIKLGYEQIKPILENRNAEVVDFIDWQKIDAYEKELGQKEGKPREKIVSVEKILDVKNAEFRDKD